MSKTVRQISTVRRWRLCLSATLALLMASLFGGYAQAQLCAMGCGNRCYNSPNPSACESVCVSRCAAGGGNQGGVSRAPRQVWQPRFAAFAAPVDNSSWGVGVGYYNGADAEARARVECERVSKQSCPIARNTDGINIALLKEEDRGKVIGYIIKAGDTMSDAVNPMIAYCRSHHPNAKCTIVYRHVGR